MPMTQIHYEESFSSGFNSVSMHKIFTSFLKLWINLLSGVGVNVGLRRKADSSCFFFFWFFLLNAAGQDSGLNSSTCKRRSAPSRSLQASRHQQAAVQCHDLSPVEKLHLCRSRADLRKKGRKTGQDNLTR